METLYHATTEEEFEAYGRGYVHEEIGRIIAIFRESARVEEPGPDAPPTQAVHEPQVSIEVPRHRREGRGLGRQRQRVGATPDPIVPPRPPTEAGGWYRPPYSQPTYYAPSQQPFHPSPSPQPSAASPSTSYHPFIESQEPVFQASPVHMATDLGEGPSDAGEAWRDLAATVDWYGDSPGPAFHYPQHHTPPPTSQTQGSASDDFLQAALDDFPDPPPLPDVQTPAPDHPQVQGDPVWERRLLPDRGARHRQWPPWS